MIHVVGLGPGNKDYILPIAIKTIKSSQMVIGASRNLKVVEDIIKESPCETMALSEGFTKIAHYLKVSEDVEISVVVSGDSGFHSMLDFVKRNVADNLISVIPGISSLQYMYSKIGLGYEKAQWLSLHGRECDIIKWLVKRKPLGILTDREQNNRYIAEIVKDQGIEGVTFYVGERLSYDDELITKLTMEECLVYKADPLSVVVVEYE